MCAAPAQTAGLFLYILACLSKSVAIPLCGVFVAVDAVSAAARLRSSCAADQSEGGWQARLYRGVTVASSALLRNALFLGVGCASVVLSARANAKSMAERGLVRGCTYRSHVTNVWPLAFACVHAGMSVGWVWGVPADTQIRTCMYALCAHGS